MPDDLDTVPRPRAAASASHDDHDHRDDEPADICYDVAVVGGGAAGLSAAVALARFRRSVVVVDEGSPRNAPAGHVHNLLTRDGASPAELYRLGRVEVGRFGGDVVAGTVRAVRGQLGAFTLELEDQTTISAGRVIVAAGGWDELPDVAGLAERWGKDVLHCGFCHGYEVRDQHVGVLATGPMAIHQAMMFRLLTSRVTLLAHTAPPNAEQTEELVRRGIAIVSGTVAEVLSDNDRLTGVRFADGTRTDLEALVVSTVVHARADFLAPLGLAPTEFAVNGHTVATRIETGPNGSTDVPGVRIAGNTSEPMAQVVNSAASGLAAASAMIGEFVFAPPTEQMTATQSQPHQPGHHAAGAGQARVLDLDAEVLAGPIADITGWLPVRSAPTEIVDLGAGTGAGTFALLRQFPHARITAVDSSAEHLQLLQERARSAGVSDSVRTIQADLDSIPWPDLGTPDLVWASASMHHLVDPARALRHAGDLLQKDGLLAVVELSGLPRFLPPTAPEDRPGLEERCHAATQHLMAAHMPHRGSDWGPKLTAAGLVVEDKLTIDAEVTSTESDAVAPYALAALQGLRDAAAPHLPADDLVALDQLLDTTSPRSILRRPDLAARTTRTVWAARRNDTADGPSQWFSATAEAANCERVLGNRRHGLDTLLTKE